MPSLFRIPQNRTGISHSLSDYLDLIRFGAALAVFFRHIRSDIFGPWLWQIRGYGHTAVMAFFVLSGFVIAYTCSSGKHLDLRDYAVSRLGRLYSVIVPAIVLTIAVDWFCAHFYPGFIHGVLLSDNIANADAPVNFLIGAAFLNQLWFAYVPLGSNLAYWSLGYEFWYYVLFGLALFLRGRLRIWLCLLAALIVGPKILLYFPVWLLGVMVYVVQARIDNSRTAGWAIFAASLAALVAVQVSGLHRWDSIARPTSYWPVEFDWYDFPAAALIGLNMLGAAMALNHPAAPSPLHALIKYIAGATFSLYLFHMPLLGLIGVYATSIGIRPSPVLSVLLYFSVFAVIFALAQVTERKKHWWKKLFLMLTQPEGGLRRTEH